MTYILLTSDMSLCVTKEDTIYRGDNMSKEITFLVPVEMPNINTESAVIFLSYIRPDGNPDMVILDRKTEKYNDNYYQYGLPVTCKLSKYPGKVLMWLSIMDGASSNPMIAKSGECLLTIRDSKSIDNCMGDHQLTALYQMKKQLDEMVKDNSGSENLPDEEGSDQDGFDAVEF